MRLTVVTALLILSASLLPAQEVVVGNIPAQVCCFFPPTGASTSSTVIDFNNPANASGTVGSATVRWAYGTSGPCVGAFKIRFFNPGNPGQLTMVAERGPFATTGSDLITVALDPPVAVQEGYLIGLAELQASCGGVSSGHAPLSHFLLLTNNDFSGGTTPAGASIRQAVVPAIRATSDSVTLAGIIPAVGNVPGSLGAAFRTTFQVTNTGIVPLSTATFIFHPAGTHGTFSDPQTTLSLPAHATINPDLLSMMGASGLGSLDVYVKGEYSPLVTAYVFNDAGGPTNGFTETMIPRSGALHIGEVAAIVFPSDLTNYRMNIGVRTLDRPVTISFFLYDAAGAFIRAATSTYQANYFSQVPLASFVAAAGTPVPNGSINLQVNEGAVIIYSSTTDNRTNDSAIYVAQPRP